MPAGEPIVEVEHVDAGYPGVTVLRDVSFAVNRGEVFVLLGGSGCGKSTIMKHMIGLNPAIAGTIRVDGLEMNRANRPAILRKIGVMYQSGALFGSMTVLENVMLPLEEFTRLPAEARRTLALMQLDLVGLKDAARKMPADLSGGMRKRAAIARALALEPSILFLDEPSAGLDPLTSSALDDLVLRLRDTRGVTFVVVTHELPSIFKIADRCAMFDRARQAMIALGRPADLRDASDDRFVREFFTRGGSNGQ
ncbi:MAG: ATP-binding cassette domain-containing protein [Kiritimatiellae bacterium]|nr:ATP-binding cassette domain-containing protein [Kiritimatiellia bacterium]